MPGDERDPTSLSPLLDSVGFRGRLVEEVGRVRRSGGFLSLVLVGVKSGTAATGAQAALTSVAHRLRVAVRAHDQIAWRRSNVGILMPGTTMPQGTRAAGRFLQIAKKEAACDCAAGVATIYGEAEGGADALVAASEEALTEAVAGQVVRSRTLEGRPQVLVVDDDREFAEALAESISDRGWEGHPCTQAADALQRVTEGTYRALFVDLMMPGLSGVELLRRALASKPGRPAALMSGYDAKSEAVLDALSLGPVTFIRKPIAPADLDAALEMFRQLLPGAGRKK